jgi:hypothetical protein
VRSGQRPISGGKEGRDVVRVLEAVNRSIEYKGLQVELGRNGHYAEGTQAYAANATASSLR